jgi:hypothetical protein
MGSLLAAAVRVHGGMDRWQRISAIRATASVLVGRPGRARAEMQFDLIASTRVPVLCLAQRVSGGLISSFRNGILSVHESDGVSPVTAPPDTDAAHTAWRVFDASEAIWFALNAPFVFAADAFVSADDGEARARVRRVVVHTPPANGIAALSATAIFSAQGVLRAVHLRRSEPVLTSVSMSAYALQEGLLIARHHRVRMTGAPSGSHASSVNVSFDAVRFD